jgi:hypothetical protein
VNYEKFKADIRLYRIVDDYSGSVIYYPSFLQTYSPEINFGNLNGIAAGVNLNIWKLLLEERFNYNSYEEINIPNSSRIKIHSHSGLYYKDILFDRNLELKTGFVFKFYDFESDDFESAYQLDFTLVGIIQQVAIVYLSLENLLNEQYFLVPYYPMRERGLRFGLAWELFN